MVRIWTIDIGKGLKIEALRG